MAYASQSLVQPYVRTKKGRIGATAPRSCSTPEAARRLAERLVQQGAAIGAIALQVSGDPDLGEFGDPEVLVQVGEVPMSELGLPF